MQRSILLVLAMCACGHSSHDTTDAAALASDATTSDASATCGATELCDGVIDDDCDGVVDEGCGRCPLLAVTCPAGCCAVPSWQLEPQGATGASIAVDAAGNIYVLYTMPSESGWSAWLAIYDAVPGTWSKRDVGDGTYRNRIALDSQGRLHLLHGGYAGGVLTYQRSDDGGQTFAVTSTIGDLNNGGVFDLAIDSTGAPHVAWDATPPETDGFSQLTYGVFDGSRWQTQMLDLNTERSAFPALVLGFADRPHLVTEAYEPDRATGTSKRYIYFDGNQWRYENIELDTDGAFATDSYFDAQALAIAADDSVTVTYTKTIANVESLVVATRPQGVTATWAAQPVAGATSFDNPSLVADPAGGWFAVTDGIDLQRGATWQSLATGVAGTHAAVARRDKYAYVVYLADSAAGTNSLQLTVVPL